MKLIIHTDGGARGNPGPAGAGATLADEGGRVLLRKKKYLGIATNNQAEYEAVILALEAARTLGADELAVHLDSQLVVEQLSGNYKVKNRELAKLYVRIHNMRDNFRQITFQHVPREENKAADALANEAMDEAAV